MGVFRRFTLIGSYLRLKYWLYRKRHGVPHPQEIYPYQVERTYLRELAKLYRAGFNLDQCAAIIKCMSCPPAPIKTRKDGSTYEVLWIQEKMFYGKELTRERLRQLIWKIWRDQRVARNAR